MIVFPFLVLRAFLLLARTGVANAILNFDNKELICNQAEAASRATVAAPTPYCNNYPSECASATQCNDCEWQSLSFARSACYDGCTYSDGTYTVERGVILQLVLVETVVPYASADILTTTTVYLGFTEGATGQMVYTFDSDGNCDAAYNDQPCTCQEVYCDDAQTVTDFLMDCSAIEEGAVLNGCDFDPFADTPTLQQVLWSTYQKACGSSAPSSAGPATTASPAIAPTGTTTDDPNTGGSSPGTTAGSPAADSSGGSAPTVVTPAGSEPSAAMASRNMFRVLLWASIPLLWPYVQ